MAAKVAANDPEADAPAGDDFVEKDNILSSRKLRSARQARKMALVNQTAAASNQTLRFGLRDTDDEIMSHSNDLVGNVEKPAEQTTSQVLTAPVADQRNTQPILAYAAVFSFISLGLISDAVAWNTRDQAVSSEPMQVAVVGDRQEDIVSHGARLPLLATGVVRDLDVVLVIGDGTDETTGAGLSDTPYELRSTPFQISKSRVEYFNTQDAQAAQDLAQLLEAEVVDLRDILPGQPLGRVFVYLSERDS